MAATAAAVGVMSKEANKPKKKAAAATAAVPLIDNRLIPKPLQVRSGEPCSITVNISGLPPPVIRWQIGRRRVKESAKYQLTTDGLLGHTLVVARAAEELEQGVWVVASNEHGEDCCRIEVNIQKSLNEDEMSGRRNRRPPVASTPEVKQKTSILRKKKTRRVSETQSVASLDAWTTGSTPGSSKRLPSVDDITTAPDNSLVATPSDLNQSLDSETIISARRRKRTGPKTSRFSSTDAIYSGAPLTLTSGRQDSYTSVTTVDVMVSATDRRADDSVVLGTGTETHFPEETVPTPKKKKSSVRKKASGSRSSLASNSGADTSNAKSKEEINTEETVKEPVKTIELEEKTSVAKETVGSSIPLEADGKLLWELFGLRLNMLCKKLLTDLQSNLDAEHKEEIETVDGDHFSEPALVVVHGPQHPQSQPQQQKMETSVDDEEEIIRRMVENRQIPVTDLDDFDRDEEDEEEEPPLLITAQENGTDVDDEVQENPPTLESGKVSDGKTTPVQESGVDIPDVQSLTRPTTQEKVSVVEGEADKTTKANGDIPSIAIYDVQGSMIERSATESQKRKLDKGNQQERKVEKTQHGIKEAEEREPQERKQEKREHADKKEPEVKEPEKKEPFKKEPEKKEPVRKEPEKKESEYKEPFRKDPEKKEPVMKEPEKKESEIKEPFRNESAAKELEKKEPFRKEPYETEPFKKEREKREPFRKEPEKKESEIKEPFRKEPDEKEPAAKELEKKEPFRKEPYKTEPVRKEPEKREPFRKEPEKKESEIKEPFRKEPDEKEPAAKELEKNEPLRKEPEKKEPFKKEPEKREPFRKEPEKKESEIKESFRKEPEKTEPETKEPPRKEPEKKVSFRKEPEKKEPETKVLEKKEPLRKEPEKKEPEKTEPLRKEPARKEPVRKEPEKKEPETIALVTKEPAKKEPGKRDPSKDQAAEDKPKDKYRHEQSGIKPPTPDVQLNQSSISETKNDTSRIQVKPPSGKKNPTSPEETKGVVHLGYRPLPRPRKLSSSGGSDSADDRGKTAEKTEEGPPVCVPRSPSGRDVGVQSEGDRISYSWQRERAEKSDNRLPESVHKSTTTDNSCPITLTTYIIHSGAKSRQTPTAGERPLNKGLDGTDGKSLNYPRSSPASKTSVSATAPDADTKRQRSSPAPAAPIVPQRPGRKTADRGNNEATQRQRSQSADRIDTTRQDSDRKMIVVDIDIDDLQDNSRGSSNLYRSASGDLSTASQGAAGTTAAEDLPQRRPPVPKPRQRVSLKPARSEESLATKSSGCSASGRTNKVEGCDRRFLRGAKSVESLSATGNDSAFVSRMGRRTMSQEWQVVTVTTTTEEIVVIEQGKDKTEGNKRTNLISKEVKDDQKTQSNRRTDLVSKEVKDDQKNQNNQRTDLVSKKVKDDQKSEGSPASTVSDQATGRVEEKDKQKESNVEISHAFVEQKPKEVNKEAKDGDLGDRPSEARKDSEKQNDEQMVRAEEKKASQLTKDVSINGSKEQRKQAINETGSQTVNGSQNMQDDKHRHLKPVRRDTIEDVLARVLAAQVGKDKAVAATNPVPKSTSNNPAAQVGKDKAVAATNPVPESTSNNPAAQVEKDKAVAATNPVPKSTSNNPAAQVGKDKAVAATNPVPESTSNNPAAQVEKDKAVAATGSSSDSVPESASNNPAAQMGKDKAVAATNPVPESTSNNPAAQMGKDKAVAATNPVPESTSNNPAAQMGKDKAVAATDPVPESTSNNPTYITSATIFLTSPKRKDDPGKPHRYLDAAVKPSVRPRLSSQDISTQTDEDLTDSDTPTTPSTNTDLTGSATTSVRHKDEESDKSNRKKSLDNSNICTAVVYEYGEIISFYLDTGSGLSVEPPSPDLERIRLEPGEPVTALVTDNRNVIVLSPATEPAKKEPETKGLEKKEPEKKEPEKKEPEKKESEKKELDKKELDKKEPEKKEPETKELDKKEPFRKESEITEPFRKESEITEPFRKEPAIKEPVRKEPEKKEPQTIELFTKEPAKKEPGKRDPNKDQAVEEKQDDKYRQEQSAIKPSTPVVQPNQSSVSETKNVERSIDRDNDEGDNTRTTALLNRNLRTEDQRSRVTTKEDDDKRSQPKTISSGSDESVHGSEPIESFIALRSSNQGRVFPKTKEPNAEHHRLSDSAVDYVLPALTQSTVTNIAFGNQSSVSTNYPMSEISSSEQEEIGRTDEVLLQQDERHLLSYQAAADETQDSDQSDEESHQSSVSSSPSCDTVIQVAVKESSTENPNETLKDYVESALPTTSLVRSDREVPIISQGNDTDDDEVAELDSAITTHQDDSRSGPDRRRQDEEEEETGAVGGVAAALKEDESHGARRRDEVRGNEAWPRRPQPDRSRAEPRDDVMDEKALVQMTLSSLGTIIFLAVAAIIFHFLNNIVGDQME